MNKTPTKRVPICLPQPMLDDLKRAAAIEGVPYVHIVRSAIKAAVARILRGASA